MANKLLLTEMDGTPEQIVFADHAGDYGPSTNNVISVSTPTTSELILLNLADAAAAQSVKIDLGANFAEQYDFYGLIEMQVASADDGSVIELRWNESPVVTAAVANLGGASGAVAAYAGYSTDLESARKQLKFIGNMIMSNAAAANAQSGFCGSLYPSQRYGSLIVINRTGQIVCDTDDIESAFWANPIITELQ